MPVLVRTVTTTFQHNRPVRRMYVFRDNTLYLTAITWIAFLLISFNLMVLLLQGHVPIYLPFWASFACIFAGTFESKCSNNY